MSISTVLLDAGGVILDESEHEAVRAQITVEVLSSVVSGYTLAAYYSDVEEAVRCFCPSAYQYVFWKHLKTDRSTFDKLYASYLNICRTRKPPLKLTPGLGDELRPIAQDFKVAIAGQYGRELLEALSQQGLLDRFAHRFTQDDFPLTKPDPRYYEQIAEACGVAARVCIMVGDRIDKDVIPARQVGMKTIRIRVGLHRNQEPRVPSEIPDAELDSLTGLAVAVRELARK